MEGEAEAAIVYTKGEAEAKALAMRAEAYRQFNEAAVLQTVLSMMPDIVRAAAEPIGKIQSLTVLSTEGASDVVRTTTDTLAQASSAVKGLTGIDLPSVIADAMGATPSATIGEAAGTVARAARQRIRRVEPAMPVPEPVEPPSPPSPPSPGEPDGGGTAPKDAPTG